MKQERAILEKAIEKIINDPSFVKKNITLDRDLKELTQEYISGEKISAIIKGMIKVYMLSDMEVFHLCNALYEILEKDSVNPQNYYTEEEVKNFGFVKKEKIKKVDTIVLEDVSEIVEGELYLCSFVHAEDIALYLNNNKFTYNFRTQREAERIIRDGKVVEITKIIQEKVEAIAKKFLDNDWNVNAVRWNVRKEAGNENIRYDKAGRKLYIKPDDNTKLDLIDGMNRTGGAVAAIREAKAQGKKISGGFSVYIHYVDEGKARQIIDQEQKATPFDEKFIETFDSKNENMESAKYLNENCEMLKNKITHDIKDIKSKVYITTFDILSKSIEHYFDLNNATFLERKQTNKFLVEYFNILLETLEKQNIQIKNPFVFVGFVGLTKQLREIDDWEELIPEKLSEINIKDITIKRKFLNAKSIEEISNEILERGEF